MQTKIRLEEMNTLVEGQHGDPFSLLGPHPVEEGSRKAVSVRAFLPQCTQAWVVDPAESRPRPMRKVHPAGFFEGICNHTDDGSTPQYHLQMTHQDGRQCTMHDPYRFPSMFTDYDLHLFGEGKHFDAYNRFGAQIRTVDGIRGVNFSVWAPNAQAVSVVGDFNEWDGRRNPMRKLVPSGVWELFVPDLEEGANYKFRVKSAAGVSDKCDPYGYAAELPPRTASRVADLEAHSWNDEAWMETRRNTDALERPVSIYEVHLGSWQRGGDSPHWLNYRDLAHRLVSYCQEMNFTHVELMPITEHPFTGSWGYQTVGYFAATSRYGTPEDFMYFVDHCHQNGIGVILDWVPAHFPKDGHGLMQFDGTPLFEHADPRQGEHPDWGTMIFNYSRHEVRNFLLANALFWLDKYHIDGLRVDAVASMLYLDYSREDGEWVPNEHGGRENLAAISLFKEFNEEVHLRHPGVLTIAEESTAWTGVSRPTYLGGLGFSLKWNMGWMNDTLEYMEHEPVHRKYHHDELTFSRIYAFTENFCLPLSHDEVVHGKGSLLDKMPGDNWQKFANLRMLYSYMWTHPGKKLLFMGGEFGQWKEWDCDSDMQWDLLQWNEHRGLKQCVADLNRLYSQEPALFENEYDESGFEWVDCHNHEDSTLSYLRRAKDTDDFLLVVCNFTPMVRKNHRLGVPENGWYEEIFCSDSEFYGGSNVGNGPGVSAMAQESHGRPFSIEIDLPPLSVSVLKPRR